MTVGQVSQAGPEQSARVRKIGEVDQSFYLIGVGASAGGLDAIKQLITLVPRDFPHSLVIVQHISPDDKSLMTELLARETSLPVREVTDDMAIEAKHIYLIPPRSNIVIQGTKGDSNQQAGGNPPGHSGLRFSLAAPTPRPGLNLPIDVFFQSLAEAVEDRAIAVILSGSGSDGSRGLRAIKDREGLVLVQDPATAAFDGMPRSAIATGLVDMILSPDAVVGEINRYLEMREKGIDSVDRIFAAGDSEFAELLEVVSDRAEFDFSLYKQPTLKRRVARRMALRGYTDLGEYLVHLRRDEAELNVLSREFLVGVTNFFRDLPVWNTLKDRVLESLFKDGLDDDPIRIWSAGCSTGEEAYSIAMLLEAYRTENAITRDFRIFATDVNERAINVARQATYPDRVREEIPTTYLNKGFLTFQSGTLTVARSIRNRVVFSVHNVIEDAPIARTDLIVCRNLLIYLGPDVQAKIMTRFAFSLRQDGFLQLGAAETPRQHGAMFEALKHKTRIYRNTRQIDHADRRSQISMSFPTASFLPRARRIATRGNLPGDDLTTLLDHLLEDGNACICIADEAAKVIRTFGDHSELLHIPTAGFSANLLDLVDGRLRSSVALVLRRTETEGEAEKDGVRLVNGEDVAIVDIKCRKISWEAQAAAFAFTFRRLQEAPMTIADPLPEVEAPNMPVAAYIQHLETEVQSLQGMLSATADDLGAVNEELRTVHWENSAKIAELETATGDIKNLLETADLAVLVLDDELCIRQFSAGVDRYVTLTPSDIGRPFENFAFQIDAVSLTRLIDDIRLSRDVGEENSRELTTRDGGFALARVRPYLNVHGERMGVVVTLQDVTAVKDREIAIQRRADDLRRFAFVAAHDLTQPMNTIESCINMLSEDLPDEVRAENAEIVGFITSAVARMKERIGGILDLARIQDQRTDLTSVDLGGVLQTCLEDLSHQVKEADADVTIATDLPAALGIPSMLLRMIKTVVSNAIKYRRDDRPCRISIERVAAPVGMVAIRIADNGIGIPEKYRDKIFQLFGRLHNETEYPGAGIGLALTQRISELLDGDIAVSDGTDGGAAFTFTLREG